MKNLFLLPTEKPSRLAYYQESTSYNKPILQLVSTTSSDYKYQHIYITSDEEIKVGDWYYLPRTNSVHKCIEATELNLERRLGVAKIILTTDPDLIKDGVQQISDEFLEWFVENPSCEEVEVETYFKKIGVETDANGYRAMDVLGKDYKIIIPQEEPKQERDEYFKHLEKDKQELGEEWEKVKKEFGFGKNQETVEIPQEELKQETDDSSLKLLQVMELVELALQNGSIHPDSFIIRNAVRECIGLEPIK